MLQIEAEEFQDTDDLEMEFCSGEDDRESARYEKLIYDKGVCGDHIPCLQQRICTDILFSKVSIEGAYF